MGVTYIILLFSLLWKPTVQESFSSTVNLASLIRREGEILDQFDKYIQREEARILQLRHTIAALRANSTRAGLRGVEPEAHVSHPLNAYRLIDFWHQLGVSASSNKNLKQLETDAASVGLDLPTDTDREGALSALLRLQSTYHLDTDELAEGWVYGHQAEPPSLQAMVTLGKLAYNAGEYGLAVQWYSAALDRGYNDSQQLVRIHLEMGDAYREMERYGDAVESARQAHELRPGDQKIKETYQTYTRDHEQEEDEPDNAPWWKPEEYEWQEDYKKLCRGDTDVTKTRAWDRLYCWYRPTNIPFMPAKEELYSLNPRVSLFYDVITNKQAAKIRRIATPMLHRAQIGNKNEGRASKKRIAKISWLRDEHSAVVRRVSRAVERVTGLRLVGTATHSELHSEALQVGNYGVGGQYEPHHDYFDTDRNMRLATFMFYLGQVHAGGATVFPRINVRVPPVRNAAAFWYNERRSGQQDHLTEHAGCPVVVGSKWIGNKWIKQIGNWNRRPCGKDYWAKDTLQDQTLIRRTFH